ncbi:hypothetical protein CVT25_010093, partial [Psilocybe cyanescens]
MEKFLNIKRHNAKCPCRSCRIKAVNDSSKTKGANKTYYVPLTPPNKQSGAYDPHALPLRKHSDWKTVTDAIESAASPLKQEEIAQEFGIKAMPALTWVGSLDYAQGMPWDYMHLLLENVVKNLVDLWLGRYKGLDAGDEDFIIPEHIWKEVATETTRAVHFIPADFVCSLGNPYNNR